MNIRKRVAVGIAVLAVSLLIFGIVFAATGGSRKSPTDETVAVAETETEEPQTDTENAVWIEPAETDMEVAAREEMTETGAEAETETETETEESQAESEAGEQISVGKPTAERVSPTEIQISWNAIEAADQISHYIVMRGARANGADTGEWKTIATVEPDTTLSVTDKLDSADPQQFSYRIDVELKDDSNCTTAAGETVLASNVMICIDPGHYAAGEAVTGEDTYDYVEGVFTLQIGLSLKNILKSRYGIDSYLTRDSGVVSLGGYTDEELDKAHIALRGEYAGKKNSTLFVSLHTNSNQESITKTIVLINKTGMQSQRTIDIANAIGTRLTATNISLGIATTGFDTVDSGSIIEWTSPYNDSLGVNGTVCKRYKSNGDDFYGVLRGATSVGIPGILIEHGYHSVVSMRILAASGSLADTWAGNDADGIASGFGFTQ
jgi:N-acetylmuramoyl-L-alanine amidase